VLLAKGRQTLQELLHGCAPLPALAVRQALLALLQQNLAACYLVPEEEGLSGVLRRAYFLYAPNTERMLQALRAPRFVQHARDRFGDAGEEAEALVEALLVNGRLRRALPPRGAAARRDPGPRRRTRWSAAQPPLTAQPPPHRRTGQRPRSLLLILGAA